MEIAVIGAGYVGLVTGVGLARSGAHRVTFVERDAVRRSMLERGELPISEPGLAEAFASIRSQIRIAERLEPEEHQPAMVFVAVATPIGEDGDPDLRQISQVGADLSAWPELDICIRSTLPPGASRRLPAAFGRTDGAHLSMNPEFLAQGTALRDFEMPTRVVLGRYPETSEAHLAILRELVARPGVPLLELNVQAAELLKNVANAFLALRLSFVNEVASLCEEYAVDVEEVLLGIGLDPRIGTTYMRPGLGFGGSCLPKELQVIAAAGRQQGLAMHLTRAASQVNAEQQERFARRILRELGDSPRRVALLGLSFKGDTDDLRGSPSLSIAKRLIEAGHVVVAHDPAVPTDRAITAVPGIRVASTAAEAATDADALVIGTDWREYTELDLDAVGLLMRSRLLFDGRNLLNRERALKAGFAYRGIGRRSAGRPPAYSVSETKVE